MLRKFRLMLFSACLIYSFSVVGFQVIGMFYPEVVGMMPGHGDDEADKIKIEPRAEKDFLSWRKSDCCEEEG